MLKRANRLLFTLILSLLTWLVPVSLALAANGVFLSNDTAESEATYVVQFEATAKGHIEKIIIALPLGTNAANAALGRVIIGDKVFEGDDGKDKKKDKKDVTLSVNPSDPDTLIVDLRQKRKVKAGTKILVELFNLNNPPAGDHAIDVTTLDKKGNVLDTVMLAYSIFATGAGDITGVAAGTGLAGGGALAMSPSPLLLLTGYPRHALTARWQSSTGHSGSALQTWIPTRTRIQAPLRSVARESCWTVTAIAFRSRWIRTRMQ